VGVEVPIIEVVADAVHGDITPDQAMERLMSVSTLAEI
jgi:glycerol-3-phosphate dehydrogenase